MFDVEVAKEVGIIAAVVFQNIAFWCQHSYANGTNYHDGAFWTYNSVKALKRIFPYLSASQIDTAIKKLVDAGLVIKGNYNKNVYDRTTWYAITEKGKSIYEKSKMDGSKIENGFPKNREPIPYVNPVHETHPINNDKGFTPPTIDELKSYAAEIGYKNFDAEYFLTYYKTAGWKKSSGKPVTNWKLTVQTWKKQDSDRMTQTVKNNPALDYTQREYKDRGSVIYKSINDMPDD